LALLYRGMLRVAEALAVRPKDVDIAGRCLRVLHGKGDRPRTIGLDLGALTLIVGWLRVREGRLGHLAADVPLICTLKGGPIQSAYVRNWLRRAAKRAGIAKRVHPHGMRHTGACELASEGVDLRVISKQLGHAKFATTQTYLDHLHPADVVKAMAARSWGTPGVQ
jgi:site-specific recombinase XerD